MQPNKGFARLFENHQVSVNKKKPLISHKTGPAPLCLPCSVIGSKEPGGKHGLDASVAMDFRALDQLLCL